MTQCAWPSLTQKQEPRAASLRSSLDDLSRCEGRGPGSSPTASAYPSRAGAWGSACSTRWSRRRLPCSARPIRIQRHRRRVPTTPLLPDRRLAHPRYLPSLRALQATWGYFEVQLPCWGVAEPAAPLAATPPENRCGAAGGGGVGWAHNEVPNHIRNLGYYFGILIRDTPSRIWDTPSRIRDGRIPNSGWPIMIDGVDRPRPEFGMGPTP